MARKPRSGRRDPAAEQFRDGSAMVAVHPLFGPLLKSCWIRRDQGNLCPTQGFAVVTAGGTIHVHPHRQAPAEQWAYVIGHCLLHLGLNHFQKRDDPIAWNTACDAVVTNFLRTLKFGSRPEPLPVDWMLPVAREESLYAMLVAQGMQNDLPPTRHRSAARAEAADVSW